VGRVALPASAKVYQHDNDPISLLDAWRKRSAYMKIRLLPLHQSGAKNIFPSALRLTNCIKPLTSEHGHRQGYCYCPHQTTSQLNNTAAT